MSREEEFNSASVEKDRTNLQKRIMPNEIYLY